MWIKAETRSEDINLSYQLLFLLFTLCLRKQRNTLGGYSFAAPCILFSFNLTVYHNNERCTKYVHLKLLMMLLV